MKHFRRLFATVATLAVAVLTLAAAPAASAMRVPPPDEGGSGAPAPVYVITGGGMPGWEITLIAVSAALVAAAAAVLLDRILAARKTRASTA